MCVIVLIIGLVLSLNSCKGADSDIYGLKYLDENVDPCDNFYQFACGNFDKYHQRTDDQPFLDLFALTEEEIVKRAHEVLSNAVDPAEPEGLKKVKTAYKACMNPTLTQLQYIDSPELALADKYEGLPLLNPDEATTPLTWAKIGELTRTFGVHHFFQFQVQNFDTENFVLLVQPDIWSEPAMIRPAYKKSYDSILEEQFKKAGNKIKGRKMAVDEEIEPDTFDILLTSIAESLMKSSRQVASLDDSVKKSIAQDVKDMRNFMTLLFAGGIIDDDMIDFSTMISLSDLQQWTDEQFGNTTDMNWKTYLHELFKWSDFNDYKNDEFPLFFQSTQNIYGILNLIRKTNPRIVKNFVLFRTFIFLAPDSTQEIRESFENYYKSNKLTYYDRWEYCTRKLLDISDDPSLSFALAYEFGMHYFNINKVSSIVRLINTLRASYNQSFELLDWVDAEDREVLKSKLSHAFILLAYPDTASERTDLDKFYENVEICQGDNYGNSQRIRAFRMAYAFSGYGKNSFWTFSPFELNALYSRASNKIKLPLAMLQDSFFCGDSPIFDYGRIGITLAHEMAHGYDTGGVHYKESPDAKNLSSLFLEKFQETYQCLIDQYSQYYIDELDVNVNGANTLDENIADNAGVRRAFAAFKNLNPPPIVPSDIHYTKDQLFFISFATMWCTLESDSYLASVTNYPPARFRIIGSLSNSPDFSSAFNCPAGSNMNPEKKCSVW